MLNFYQEKDFNQTVYVVTMDEIEEWKLANLCYEYAKSGPTPQGIKNIDHIRGNELWTWGATSQHPRCIEKFDTEAEAEHALLLCHLHDMQESDTSPSFMKALMMPKKHGKN